MFPNLRAEMARAKITIAQIADAIGKTISTTSLKLNGKNPITLDEAFSIKETLKTDLPLETLFESEAMN